jgi:hypothetical protein
MMKTVSEYGREGYVVIDSGKGIRLFLTKKN